MKRAARTSSQSLIPAILLLLIMGIAAGTFLSKPADVRREAGTSTEGDISSVVVTQAPEPLFQLLETLPQPMLTGLPPEGEVVPNAVMMLDSSSVIDMKGLERILETAEVGQVAGFPTPRQVVPVRVTAKQKDAKGRGLWVSGLVGSVTEGAFALVRDEASGAFSGHLLLHRTKKAYVIEAEQSGRLLLQERPIDAVICAGMPPEPNPVPLAMKSGVERLADPVPILDSLPTAVGVLYIDFDGEVVTGSSWNGGQTINALPAVMAGQPMTAAQMTAVWAAVAEDFAPFDVSVTTSRARFNAAPQNRRMSCIQTPTKDAAPTAGGVAFLNSFSANNNNPCWSFNSSNVRVMAMTISHELGHTVGLSHDGRIEPNLETYYGGHGSGVTRWGPLMGAPFSAAVTQWSKGEYYLADRTAQDDLDVITRTQNFGYRADTVANTPALAGNVSDNLFGNANQSGIIISPSDKDVFRFQTAGGTVTFNGIASALPESNLDIKLRILQSNGTEMAVADPVATLSATLATTLTAGTYFIEVSGTGFGTPLANPPTGYTNYGSLGAYTLTGTFPPLPQVPLITQEPESPPAAVLEGRSVTFSVSVISNRTPRYQWIKIVGGVETNISGATSRTYTIPAVGASHIADYKVRVTNSAGFVDSEVVSLDVVLKPKFVTQPASGIVSAGDPLILSPVISGNQPMTYQWSKNGVPIPGETGAIFNIAAVQWSDEGSYRLLATNAAGATTSASAAIKIESPPVVIQDLPLFAVRAGRSARLTLPVKGNPVFRYQWLKDDMPVPGATGSTLTLPGDPVNTPGIYKLQVTNSFGVFTSDGTTVVVDDALVITQQPVGATGKTAGEAHTMSVQVAGTLPQYQWQLNGKDLPGENGPVLVLDPLTWFNNGKYTVVVTNRVSRVVSRAAAVSVSSAPVIITSPTSRKAARRSATTFTVKAQGTGKLRYQWFKDGSPIIGATKSSLRLTRVDTPSEGNYSVQVANLLGDKSSDPGALVVEDVPVVVVNPSSSAFEVNKAMTLGVSVSGTPALRYQWQRNRKNLAGQTGETLVIPSAQLTDSALYRVVVTNDVGKATSREARATVMLPPTVTTQPLPASQYQGFNASFTVKAGGSGPFTYRWRRNGEVIKTTTTPTLSLTNLKLEQAGDYSVEVVNAVNSVVSNVVPLEVLTVPTPTITNYVPKRGKAADKVALIGNNLRFAKSATLAGRAVGFVVTANNDVVVTSPTNAISGPVRITTPGGTVTTSGNFTVATEFQNDRFENSIVVTSSSYSVRGVNTRDYTAEAGEPGFFSTADKSAWWRWTCPATGSYEIDTSGSSQDTVMTVFAGDTLTNLSRVASNNNAGPGLTHSRVVVNGIQGVVYRISVDVVDPDFASRVALNIKKLAAIPLAGDTFDAVDGAQAGDTVVKAGGWQGVGVEGALVVADGVEDQAVLLGGSKAPEAAQIWHPALDEGAVTAGDVTTAFSARLVGDEVSDDFFAWTIYEPGGEPLASLRFSAENGGLQAVNAAGESVMLETVLARECEHRFELTLHLDEGTWSLSIDGVVALARFPLGWMGEGKAAFGDASASWEPGVGGSPAGMVFDDFEISLLPLPSLTEE